MSFTTPPRKSPSPSHGSVTPMNSRSSVAEIPSTPVQFSSPVFSMTPTSAGEKGGLHLADATPGTVRFLFEVGMTSSQGQLSSLIKQCQNDLSLSSSSSSSSSSPPSSPLSTPQIPSIRCELLTPPSATPQSKKALFSEGIPDPESPSSHKLRQLLQILTEEVKDLSDDFNSTERPTSSSSLVHILIGFFLAIFFLFLGHFFFNMFDYFIYGFDRNILLGDLQNLRPGKPLF